MQGSFILTLAALVVLAAGGALIAFWQRDNLLQPAFAPTQRLTATASPLPTATGQPQRENQPESVATNLDIPWEIAFMPDGSLLVTERPGRLVKISQNKTVIPIQGVHHVGEGGLLGLALHPNFSQNNWLYLYLTTRTDGNLFNRVERYRLDNTTLTDRTVILDNIPGSQFHDGGRLAFGPDGLLYITTGDAGREDLAQDTASLAGKILRIRDDGSIPADNPFQNAVYSYGHRNPQGLAWDGAGNLWATEHGRSGVQSGFDEINLITPGTNYGWPTIQGDKTRPGMQRPAIHSGPDETWAPSGATILGTTLLFAGLRGEALYRATLAGSTVQNLVAHFPEQFGRLRTVARGPDGFIYILTNNRDGRGQPKADDDKIIRLNPATLTTP